MLKHAKGYGGGENRRKEGPIRPIEEKRCSDPLQLARSAFPRGMSRTLWVLPGEGIETKAPGKWSRGEEMGLRKNRLGYSRTDEMLRRGLRRVSSVELRRQRKKETK